MKPYARDRQDKQRADARALTQVRQLIDDGEYDAAGVLGWEVQRSAPGDPEIWLLLARIDQVRGQYPAALYAARMATRLEPEGADGWISLAETALTRDRWRAEGLDAAVQATTIAPDNPRGWIVLARAHLAAETHYEAAVAAERAAALDPRDPATHRVLGEVALAAGEWSHASTALNRALELAPTDAMARAGLEKALQAQAGESLAQLRRGEQLSPAFQEAPARRSGASDDHGSDAPSQGSQGSRPTSSRIGTFLPWTARSTAAVIAVGALLGAAAGLALPSIGVLRAWLALVAVGLVWIAAQPRPRPALPEPDEVLVRVLKPSDPLPEPKRVRASGSEPAGGDPGVRASGSEPTEPAAGVSEERDTAERTMDLPQGPDHVAGNGERPAPPASDNARPAASEPRLPNGDRLPSDPEALATLSREYLAELDLDAARTLAERLSVVSPDSVETHRALAAVALAAQDYEVAEWHYGQVLEREPLDQEANERLLLAQAGRSREQARARKRGKRARASGSEPGGGDSK